VFGSEECKKENQEGWNWRAPREVNFGQEEPSPFLVLSLGNQVRGAIFVF